MNKVNNMWDWLISQEITTEHALQLVTAINGYSIETLNDALFALTGYRDREQYEDAEE